MKFSLINKNINDFTLQNSSPLTPCLSNIFEKNEEKMEFVFLLLSSKC